ncbi:putative ribonuclease H-like domain-containing protein [Tanacetum coccineum]
MHDVPPPMTGNYMPSGPDIEVDYSQFTYGPKQTQPSKSESQSSEFDTCESNISTEPSELVSEPVVNESNVECQPKVWSDAPIIKEYESDSEDEYVSIPTKEQETPSFANQQVKTPRETVKNQFTHSQKPKVDKKDLGYGFTVRACFVCGSLNHLIKDCDFHEKRMARKAELNNGWNNVQRVNKQNQFVPSAVLTRTGKIPVSTARASGTKNFSTARQSFNRQAVPTSTAMKVNTSKPIVNRVRPANVFHKTHSPSSRPFKKTTVLRTDFSKQKVNTAKVNAVSTVGGKRETAVKPSAGCNWRPQRYNWHNSFKHKSGIVDSGCSRHMTGNKAYLAEFQDFNGGPVAFGGSKGYITGKGKIKTGIKREYSNARTPQQNGVAERKNRTFIEAARPCPSIHFYLTLIWAEASVLVLGGCQFLGRRLISWQCKKQTIVATSTTEAEYVAAASCCGQVLWIQNQMLDYGFNFMNTKIYIDNESTICIVKNPVYHSKTKHIAIRHHFIRDAYEKKLIQVLKIHTDDNVADLLTKAFDVSRFQFLVVSIGMINP